MAFDFGTQNFGKGGVPSGGGANSPFGSGLPMSPSSNFSPFQKYGTGVGGAGSNQFSPYGMGGFGSYQPGSIPNTDPNIGYGGISQNPSAMHSGLPGIGMGSTQDPQLTMQFFNWLQSQIGRGTNPYPGQLTAPPNDILQSIQSLFTGGKSTSPSLQALQQMATTGDPTDVGPAWNAMVAAQQQNIQKQQANLKEQFAFGGNLAGSPFGNAMSDFNTQTTLDQNALLAQMQQQASEAAAGRMNSAQQGLLGAGENASGQLQQIQQAGLTNQYQEWLRNQPQYNPLLQYMFGAATTYPPYFGIPKQQSPWGGLLQGTGSILSSLGDAGLL